MAKRRGAGPSDGSLPLLASRPAPDIAGPFGEDSDDIEGALRALQARPDVDGQRVILLGESAGGATAMALMRRKPPGLRGVVNVAGGLNPEGCRERGQDALVGAMTAWQGPGAVPQLWIYARNDEHFPPPLVARMRGRLREPQIPVTGTALKSATGPAARCPRARGFSSRRQRLAHARVTYFTQRHSCCTAHLMPSYITSRPRSIRSFDLITKTTSLKWGNNGNIAYIH